MTKKVKEKVKSKLFDMHQSKEKKTASKLFGVSNDMKPKIKANVKDIDPDFFDDIEEFEEPKETKRLIETHRLHHEAIYPIENNDNNIENVHDIDYEDLWLRLSGKQKVIFSKLCIMAESNSKGSTGPVYTNEFCKDYDNIQPKLFYTYIQRLVAKQFMARKKGKPGVSGFSIFEIPLQFIRINARES